MAEKVKNKKNIDDDLPAEFVREIKRRAADHDSPVRYVIYSQIIPKGKWRLFFDVSDSTFCENIDSATLFKREYVAKAITNACFKKIKVSCLLLKSQQRTKREKYLNITFKKKLK